MELIKRYIYAIQKRLPRSGRDDIAKEIESLIMDELEGKFGAKPEYTKSEMEQVISEMGSPREVAMGYRGGNNYLIGPELFSSYTMILWIVIGATALGLTISYIVEQFTLMPKVWDVLWNFIKLIPNIFSSSLGAVGAVTLVFIIIQYVTRYTDKKDFDINSDWKPSDLPELPQESDKVHIAGPIIVMALIVVWAVFINTYARVGGVGFVENISSDITIVPIFSIEAVRQFLPLWNTSIIAGLVLQMLLIISGKWTFSIRWYEVGTDLLSIIILGVMISGPALIAFDNLTTPAFSWIMDFDKAERVYFIVLKVIMGLSVISLLSKSIKIIIRQIKEVR